MTQDRPPVCDYEGSDYQEKFWEQGGRAYEDLAESIALSRLLPAKGKLLLELGAGAGRNTPRYVGYERIVLLDYSRSQLERAQERLGNSCRYIYVAADVYRLPFKSGVFDGATMIRVIHHLTDAPLALKNVRETLQPGGVFILEFANKQNLKSILRYALRQQDWSPFTREPIEFAKLNFDNHPKAIWDWMAGAGFRINRRLTVSHFRMAFFKKYFPPALLARLDSAAQFTGDWWQLSPSVFVSSTAVGEAHGAPGLIGEEISAPDSLFACPECRNQEMAETAQGFECGECGNLWPLKDGIYDFRVFSSTQK